MRPIKLVLVLALLACTHPPAAKPASPGSIDLDFKDAPIAEVVRAIAERGHTNLTLDGDVSATVSIRVRGAPWRDVLEQIVRDHGLRVEQAGPVLRIVKAATPPGPTSYAGAPIVVDFNDTPIRDAARTIAEQAKVEIRVADGVEAAVTLRLRNAPWDLALDHIARKYGLRVTRTGDVIEIAR